MIKTGKFIYIALIILVLFPYNLIPQLPNIITPAVALLIGIVYAIIFKCPYPKFNKNIQIFASSISCRPWDSA